MATKAIIEKMPVKKAVNKSKKKRSPVKLLIKTDIQTKENLKALPEKVLLEKSAIKLEKSNSFDELRKQNLSSFKSAIEPHIIDLEVNFARINTEEKLASSGNVIYLTEKEYEEAGLRLPPQEEINEYARKKNKEAKNSLLWTAAYIISSLMVVAVLVKMKQNGRLYIEV